jgi:pimeloyl-ACP methyl ester carboxylesterase
MQRGHIERWRVDEAVRATDGTTMPLAGYVYLPQSAPEPRGWLVSVHGISRRAQQHAQLLAPLAEALGFALATPRFTASAYGDYQRLGRQTRPDEPKRRDALRADLALIGWLEAWAAHVSLPVQPWVLMGFSGGAQFAHRFALAHPERVAGTIAVAAGWYTWPDAAVAFPHGCRASRRMPGQAFHFERWLALPSAALVGEHDVEEEPAMRQTARLRMQGLHRRERAERWAQAMNEAARIQGLPTRCHFEMLPGAAHSFRACVEQGGLRERVAAIVQHWGRRRPGPSARPAG